MTTRLAIAVVFGGGGCGQILDLPDDPRFVASSLCQAGSASMPGTAHVRVRLCDWASPNCSVLVSGAVADVCDKKDVSCLRPIAADVRDVDGVIEFDVPTLGEQGAGFDGYLRVNSSCETDEACTPIQSTMFFVNPPIYAETELTLPLFYTGVLPPLLSTAGAAVDPGKGHVFIMARDCLGGTVSGATYALGSGSVPPTYFRSGIMSATFDSTDHSGLGAFVDVPPGPTTVRGAPGAGPFGEVGLYVAPSTISVSSVVVHE